MMTNKSLLAILISLIALVCCGVSHDSEESPAQVESAIAGSNASGVIPSSLPAHMSVGLFENLGGTWLKTSGVKWDMRYAYFTMGWLNRWGYGPPDGQSALDYMQECDSQGFIPVIQYYILRDESPASDESKTLVKTQTVATMSDYWSQFKVLMQRAKQFGKPVVIILEGDGFGYLEQQSNENPNTYAAVAASGIPELAGLPNTVAGFGMAYLQMKNAMGASNVVMGPDVPVWATGDISYYTVTDPLQPHVDKQYAFLAPLGLAANQTGLAYDFVAADPLDADSDWWRLVNGVSNKWWDASDTAPIYSASFNRYAEWLHLFNQKSGKRWILWQVPIGNSALQNVWNNGQPGQGYKDNRPEYFFGPSRDAHLAKFADTGVMALLFGQGESGTANYTNDTYSDGQLFLKTHVGAMISGGGFPLDRGTGATDAGVDVIPPVDSSDVADTSTDTGSDVIIPNDAAADTSVDSTTDSATDTGSNASDATIDHDTTSSDSSVDAAKDSGQSSDSGTQPPPNNSGGCSVGASSSNGFAWMMAILTFTLLASRRRETEKVGRDH